MPRSQFAAVTLAVALAAGFGAGRAAAQKAAPCAANAATARLEQQLFTMINAARAAAAVPPLRRSTPAADAARCHSEEMARHGRLSHTGADGSDIGERLRQAGAAWSRAAENVGEAPSIASVQRLMMDEPRGQPNHRANILDPHLTRLGVGIARRGTMLFVTEDFYTPPHD